MNLEESEYHMILTQDRSSAFKIVAELYSFKTNPNLLTVYNYEDEAVEEMIRISEKKGYKTPISRVFMAEHWDSIGETEEENH